MTKKNGKKPCTCGGSWNEGIHTKDFIAQEKQKSYEEGKREERTAAIELLRGVAEIYIGMEGCHPETAPEAYQEQVLRDMYNEVQRAISILKETNP